MEFSGNNNNNKSPNITGLLRYKSDPTSLLANLNNMTSSGLSCDVINTVDVMKKGAMNSQQLPPKYPRKNGGQSYVKPVNIISSTLVRQNSSPAGLFPHQLNPQSGGCYMDLKTCSGGLSNRMDFFSSLGKLSRISEADDYKCGATINGSSFASFGYAEDFFKSDGLDDSDRAPFVDHFQNNNQIEEPGDLSHRLLSVPKTKAHDQTDAKKKLLHFEVTVPCKVRAKRGCATHPRSIAERVRRTRISERIRKLQDIVPNMDKQTTTAKMLDFAVEYIKDLQKQYKALIEIRARCKCSASAKVNLNEAF